MNRTVLLGALLFGGIVGPGAPAWAEPLRFRWQTGQVLDYQVEQQTRSVEVVGDTTSDSTTRINEVKRWEVLSVAPNGEATLRLTLVRLRLESASGDTPLVFDSTAPDKSDPQMRDQLSKFVGVPLAVVRMASTGQVLEMKEGKFGSLARFETEPPFVMVLAADGALKWKRAFTITLEPPQGTGEKYASTQDYTEIPEARKGPIASFRVKTSVNQWPEAAADQLPLLPLVPEGTVEFDTSTGLLHQAVLTIDREIKGHQGEGSSYHFTSSYREARLPTSR
jgi:hypothetical protein